MKFLRVLWTLEELAHFRLIGYGFACIILSYTKTPQMNHPFLLLVSNLTSVACVVSAGYLASKGIEGWGWFLFVAVLCAQSFSSCSE